MISADQLRPLLRALELTRGVSNKTFQRLPILDIDDIASPDLPACLSLSSA
jgi:hypothetical protein